MADIEVTTRPSGVTGSPGPAPERPRIELVLTPETGAETVKAEGSKSPDRAATIARAKARAAKGGDDKPAAKAKEPTGQGAEGEDDAPEDKPEPVVEETEESVETEEPAETADDPPPGDEAPADLEAEVPVIDDDQLLHANLAADRLQRENDALYERVEQFESGLLGEDARASYSEDPAAYVRAHISSLFGLDPADEGAKKLLARELVGLLTDLTVAASGAGISAEKIAQIEAERVGRHDALHKRARKATKQSGEQRASDRQTEEYLNRDFLKAAGSKFPHLALAPELDGITPGRAIMLAMRRAHKAGTLKVEGLNDDQILAEGAKLANASYRMRGEKVSTRVSSLSKAQPKPAAKPAVAGKPAAQPGKPQTGDKPKPRTLSASEAGTPAPKPKPAPKGPREVVIVRDPDRSERDRRGIIDSYKEKQRQSRA